MKATKMFWRIVLLFILILMLANSHSFPVNMHSEDIEENTIYSDTSLIDSDDYDYPETSSMDSIATSAMKLNRSETNTADVSFTTTENDAFMSFTVIPRTKSDENQNKTILFRTLVYDGPLIVEKMQRVKISQKIPLFFRLALNSDQIKDDLYVIKPPAQDEEITTTDSNLNTF